MPIAHAPDDEAAATSTPAAYPPAGWERFEEGEFAGYAPAGSLAVYLPADVLSEEVRVFDEIDEDRRRMVEAVVENMGETDLFFILLGDEFELGSNVNIQACEVNGQRIWGESIIQIGFMALGLELEEVDELAYGEKTATVFRAQFGPEFDTFQLVVKGGECNFLVTLTLPPGDYEGFAPNFREFIRLLEYRGEAALE